MRRKAELGILLATLIWATTYVVVKDALAYTSALAFLVARFSLAGLVLALVHRASLRGLTREDVRAGTVLGGFLFVGFSLLTVGLTRTLASRAAFIIGSEAILTPVLLVVFWGRREKTLLWIGALAVISGLYLMTVPSGGLHAFNRGDLLVFLAAATFALHTIYISRYTVKHTVAALMFIQVSAAAAFCAMALPVFAWARWEAPRLEATPSFFVAIFVTAIGSTVIGFSLQVWGQRHTTASRTALLFSMVPVFAALFSYLTLGERLGGRELTGAGLIFSGVLLAVA